MERVFLLAVLVAAASAAAGNFDYQHQDEWGNISAVCDSGTRQSPIDISSTGAVDSDELLDLVLQSWNQEREGSFHNTGTSVKFSPDDTGETPAFTITHEGTYQVLQFHLHWGDTDAVGSEHIVDGSPTSAEIHFVHGLVGDTSGGVAGNSFAVVGVQAVADPDMEISGVWSELNVTAVQGFDESINVTVTYSDLLPESLNYYYYEGSLTTPACSEVVQWFLLQQTIRIPAAYLEELRRAELLTFNYRDTQPLNGRTVALHGQESGSEGLRPLLSLTTLSLLLFAVFVVVR